MGLDVKGFKQKFSEQVSRRGASAFWKPHRDKQSNIRLLPKCMDDIEKGTYADFAYAYDGHFVGPVGGKIEVLCLRDRERMTKESMQACPICVHVDKLYRSHNNEQAYSLKKKPRYLINIVDMDDREKGVQHMLCGQDLYEKIGKGIVKAADSGIDMFDARTGHAIEIDPAVRDPKLGYINYNVSIGLAEADISGLLKGPEWKEAVRKLGAFVPSTKTSEELQALLSINEEYNRNKEAPAAETDDDDDDEKTTTTTTTMTTKASAAKEPSPAQAQNGNGVSRPECFGDEYTTRAGSKCLTCEHGKPCHDKFLNG